MKPDWPDFITLHMRKAKRLVPARLQSALALLEKLRDHPSLKLEDHLAARGSSGLQSHETFGDRAHQRFELEPVNRNHGRRSSNLQDWGKSLLDILGGAGFSDLAPGPRGKLIEDAQRAIVGALRGILDQEPLEARVKGRSAEAAIGDLLRQAEGKGKIGEVAQYLVGAKLALRFERDIPVHPANKADRKSRGDQQARLGDFKIGNAVIEVAAGLPDEKHLSQLVAALQDSDVEAWLLTRADRVETWRREVDGRRDIDGRRVVVASIESFVGQNISELGGFSASGKADRLRALFELYNERWVGAVGTPGIRIIVK